MIGKHRPFPDWIHKPAQSHPVQPGPLGLRLQELGYDEKSLCAVLGIRDVPLINPHDRPSYLARLQEHNDARALAIAFWLLHQPSRRHQIEQLVGGPVLQQLLECGFISETSPGILQASVDLYPCLGDLVFTDPLLALSYGPQHVYQLGTDSYVLARVTPRRSGLKALDLCTGSGIHAIQSAHHYQRSVGVDLNPRALLLSRLNAALNGVDSNCEFLEGDLYAPVAGEQFDLITMNPPFVPTPDEDMQIHRTGGESGEIVSQRAVAGLPEFLAPGGTFSMVLDFPVIRSSSYLERLSSWLGSKSGWGIAVLNFGHVSVERYIKEHVDPSDINQFNTMYQRYLASYQRQGIYEVGFANVFIRRLPEDHPGFAVEHVMVNPYLPIQQIVEAWLQALTQRPAKDWETSRPRCNPWIQDLWLNHKKDRGMIEFSQATWSGPLQTSGDIVEFLTLLGSATSAGRLAERWARQRKLSSEEARQQVQAYLGELATRLLII